MGSSWALVPIASRSRFLAMRQLEVPREVVAEAFAQGLHAPVLPEEGMAAAGAEVGEAQVFEGAQAVDLLPDAGHGAGVEDLELEPAHGRAGRRGSGVPSGWRGRGFPRA